MVPQVLAKHRDSDSCLKNIRNKTIYKAYGWRCHAVYFCLAAINSEPFQWICENKTCNCERLAKFHNNKAELLHSHAREKKNRNNGLKRENCLQRRWKSVHLQAKSCFLAWAWVNIHWLSWKRKKLSTANIMRIYCKV